MAVKAVSDLGTKLNSAPIVGDTLPTSGFKFLIGVKSTPAKGEAPEQLDATETHDPKTASIPGRQNVPALEYTFNHTKENAQALIAIEGKRHAFLETLPQGDGYLVVGVLSWWSNGTSINSVHDGTINITAESVEYIEDTSTYVAAA